MDMLVIGLVAWAVIAYIVVIDQTWGNKD